jgi:hypothetical protein
LWRDRRTRWCRSRMVLRRLPDQARPFDVCRISMRPMSPPIQSTGDTRASQVPHPRSKRSNCWSKVSEGEISARETPLRCLDHAMYSELRIDINQVVDVVGHHLCLEQDGVRFLSNFGNDLLEPPINAIDQHWAPILRTKDYVVLARKDDVAIRSVLHPATYSSSLYNHNHQEGRAFLPMAKAKGFARISVICGGNRRRLLRRAP